MRLELEPRSNTPSATLDEPRAFDAELSDDSAMLVTKGIAAAQKGDREQARELLTRATNIDPASENAWMWLASISDYPEELLAFLNKVLAINPHNLRALEWHAATRSLLSKTFVQRGIAAYNKNSVELADSCFDEALSHDEGSALAWFWKARVSSSDDKKVEYLERALEIDPGNEVARQALDLLKPPTPEATLEEAKWAAVAGKAKQALEILDKVLTNGHATAEAWVLRSHLTLRLAEKVEALEMALELEPDNQTARASYDFLTATVRDANLANDQEAVEDEVDETVQATAVDPASEVGHESREVEEIFDAAPEYIDPDHPTVDRIAVSPFLERVDDQPSETYESTIIETGPVNGLAAVEPPLEAYEPVIEETRQAEVEPSEVVEVREIFVEGEAIPAPSTGSACAFCDGPVEPQAFECTHCYAVLTLSDIESLLANQSADRDTIHQAITIMEAEWNEREFDVHELTILGIGHFNLRNFEKGFKYLQEASRLDPNNVILGGQVNALAIRLDEMRRQEEIDESKPKGRSILVVDDSVTVRKLISAKLEKSGHNVTCGADGVEGLERLEDGIPDLVLLDITMPRMDGYEVCKQIRSNPAAAGLPVVMISGKDGFFDKVRGKMAGCTGYVTKPFGPETLMKALETYLLPDSDRLPENDRGQITPRRRPMEQPELRVFFEKAGSQLAGIRGGLLLAAENGFSVRDVEIAASRLDVVSTDAAACELSSVSSTATGLATELRGIASSGNVSHSDAIRSLDIVARVEAALLEISLRSDEFLTGVDELVESSFGQLQDPEAAADESIADEEEEEDFEIDEETLEIFRSEADGLLANITANLKLLGASPDDTNALWEIRRNAHTFKGAAGIIGFKAASSLAHRVEDLLDQMVESRLTADARVIELLANATDHLCKLSSGTYVDDTGAAEALSLSFDAISESLSADSKTKGQQTGSRAPTVDPGSTIDRTEIKKHAPIVRVSLDRLDDLLAAARSLISNGSELARCLMGESIDGLAPLIESQGMLADEILQKLLDIRMVRFGTLETRLSRAVHVTCQEEDKKAMVSISGGDVEIDTQMIDALVEPLLHLLKNAVVHGIESAEMRRLLGKPEKGQIEIEARSGTGELCVTVSDDGKGISTDKLIEKAVANGLVTADAARTMSEQEAIELIFHRGLTTAETLNLNAGRGVGMSIIRQSVESQGGTLTVTSGPQNGSCFTMTIPTVKATPAAVKPAVEPLSSVERPLVLVVDDSASIRKHMAKFVEDAGLRVITAVDGADALELLLNGVHEPDLIFSDVEMPNMNGWEFLQYVKTDKNFGHVPMVMVTSLDADNYRQMASRLGASDYIVKPFGAKDLENILAKFCAVSVA